MISSRTLILLLTNAVAVFSEARLGLWWYQYVSEGRYFDVWWDVLLSGVLMDSVSFTWPFAVAGFWLGHFVRPLGDGLLWLLGVVGVGTFLFFVMTGSLTLNPEGRSPAEYLAIHGHLAMPALFGGCGFLAARVFRQLAEVGQRGAEG